MEKIKWIFWQCFIGTIGFFEWLFGDTQEPNAFIFWNRVSRCLVKFHSMSPEDAANKIDEYLVDFKGDKKLLTNRDPLEVANEIAGYDVVLTADQYRQLYVKDILNG